MTITIVNAKSVAIREREDIERGHVVDLIFLTDSPLRAVEGIDTLACVCIPPSVAARLRDELATFRTAEEARKDAP